MLFRAGIIARLIAAGFEVYVIAPNDAHTSALIALGTRFHELPISTQGRNVLDELSAARRLRRLYEKVEPDLVFHYTIKLNIYGVFAAHRLGIPSVCMVPGLGTFPDIRNNLVRVALARGYAYAARHASEIWFLNQHDYGFFESRGWLERTTARILPGEGVDTRRFAVQPLPRRRRPRVLFVGRLLATKGVETFATAARLARDLGLDMDFGLLGHLEEHSPSGISAELLQSWVRSGVLTYHGATDDVRPYLTQADIVVLPTYYREGLNRVLQEAMASGRPVVTTNVPGAGELVTHESTGYIVPVRDPEAICEALRYHFNLSRERREAMGKRARKHIVRYHDEDIVHGHYFDAIARQAAATSTGA